MIRTQYSIQKKKERERIFWVLFKGMTSEKSLLVQKAQGFLCQRGEVGREAEAAEELYT